MATLTEKAPKEAAADAPPKKKGKKKKLIILVVVIVVLAVAAKFFVLGGSSKPSANAAPKPGPLVALDAVTVNLAGGHYLRVGVTVQFTSKVSASAPPDGTEATDETITYFTGQQAAPLETAGGLANAKKGLENKLKAAYPDDPIFDVLFTTFVVQ